MKILGYVCKLYENSWDEKTYGIIFSSNIFFYQNFKSSSRISTLYNRFGNQINKTTSVLIESHTTKVVQTVSKYVNDNSIKKATIF